MISQSDKKRFRAIAHKLHPVVTVAGNGLSDPVMAELARALEDHELIKVKVVADRDERKALIAEMCEKSGAELVQTIGGIAVVYRPAAKPDRSKSNVLRTDIL
ncbi:MAG: ribosome assembly RNA-binding protein YhbY [Pseudomonadales bacterium]|nr:ribosome assembly RNA-binding protein YhbY [Pseudomonadales bacterium]